MASINAAPTLTVEEQASATRIYEKLQPIFMAEAQRLSQLMASKPTGDIFGKTEFELRDKLHDMGAHVLEVALEERKKGGTKGRA